MLKSGFVTLLLFLRASGDWSWTISALHRSCTPRVPDFGEFDVFIVSAVL